MGLVLRNISKVVTGEMHPAEVDLKFEMGSSDVLLGRTMAGKTSLLRILAGLDRPSSGQVLVDDRDVTGVSVRKRSIAMVYQQFINDPSLSVYANIAPTFKIAGTPKKEIDAQAREVAAMLHLETMLDRIPAALSGGNNSSSPAPW